MKELFINKLKKLKKKKKSKKKLAFTLVELLAVIVILAVIMIVAIPSVLDVLESSKIKTFAEYVSKANNKAIEKYLNDLAVDSLPDGCYIYNIETDLGFSTTGDFKGYVLVNTTGEDEKYYITLWSNDFMLIAYDYTDGINYNGKTKSIEDSLETYDESRKDELTPSFLCNYACETCTYANAENDTNGNSGAGSSLSGDITKVKGATVLLSGQNFNVALKQLANSSVSRYTTSDNTVEYIKFADSLPDDSVKKIVVSSNTSTSAENPVYAWLDGTTIYMYTEATKIFLDSNSERILHSFTALKNADEFLQKINTIKATNIREFFYNCTSLESVDLSNWNTKNVTNYGSMFAYCKKLTNINLSSFTLSTSAGATIGSMFSGCTELTSINFGNNWNTSKVYDMGSMFQNCKKITAIDVSNWNTSKVANMSAMFQNCSELTSLNVSHWNTSSVTKMNNMFEGCKKLSTIDVTNWDVSNVYLVGSMFANCGVVALETGNWNTSKFTSIASMFDGASKLRKLDVTNWDVSNVTAMHAAFNSVSVEDLDFSNWKLTKCSNYQMAFRAFHTNKLDLRGFDVSTTTTLSQMFAHANVNEMDISTWDTSKITNMSRMFYYGYFGKVYVGSKWTTKNVTAYGEIFQNAKITGGLETTMTPTNYGNINYAKADEVGSPGVFTYKEN